MAISGCFSQEETFFQGLCDQSCADVNANGAYAVKPANKIPDYCPNKNTEKYQSEISTGCRTHKVNVKRDDGSSKRTIAGGLGGGDPGCRDRQN